MYSLFVVFILGLNPAQSRVVGSAEFRFQTREQCMAAKQQIDSQWQVDNHKVKASCVFKTN